MPSDLNWCRLWWNYTVCRDAFFMRTCFVDFMILVYVLWIKKSYVWFNEFFSYFNLLLVQCSFLRRRLEQFWFFCVHILNWRFRKLNTWKHPYAALYLAHESWIMRSMCLFEFKQHAWENGDCYPWITNLVCIILLEHLGRFIRLHLGSMEMQF